jgi:hypothetical protein
MSRRQRDWLASPFPIHQRHNRVTAETEERLAGGVASKVPLKQEQDNRKSLQIREVSDVKRVLSAYVLARWRSATPCPIGTRAVTPNRNRRHQTQHGHATPESTATRILINDEFGTYELPDLITLCCKNDIILRQGSESGQLQAFTRCQFSAAVVRPASMILHC